MRRPSPHGGFRPLHRRTFGKFGGQGTRTRHAGGQAREHSPNHVEGAVDRGKRATRGAFLAETHDLTESQRRPRRRPGRFHGDWRTESVSGIAVRNRAGTMAGHPVSRLRRSSENRAGLGAQGLLAATIYIPPNAGQAIEMLVDALQNSKTPPERAITVAVSVPPLESLRPHK